MAGPRQEVQDLCPYETSFIRVFCRYHHEDGEMLEDTQERKYVHVQLCPTQSYSYGIPLQPFMRLKFHPAGPSYLIIQNRSKLVQYGGPSC
jgi:hypothetical protein